MTRTVANQRQQLQGFYYSVGLDGQSGTYIDVPFGFDLTSTDWSFLGICRVDIISNVNAATYSDPVMISQKNGAGTGRSIFDINTATDVQGTNLFGTFLGGATTTGTKEASAGQWFWWSATYTKSSNTIKLYVNGAVILTTTGVTIEAASGNFRLGSDKSGTTNNMRGQYTQFIAYQKTLTATEISDWYYLSAKPTGQAVQYLFTDGSGTTITDTSGNAHNGAIVGTAPWNANVPSALRTTAATRQTIQPQSASILFDGSSGCYLNTSQSALNNIFDGDFTILGYFKFVPPTPLSDSDFTTLFSFRDKTDNIPLTYFSVIQEDYNTGDPFPDGEARLLYDFISDNGNEIEDADGNFGVPSTLNVNDGKWHSVAVRRAANTFEIWLDGVKDVSVVNVATLNSCTAPDQSLGGQIAGFDNGLLNFFGNLFDWQFYTSALTDSEILQYTIANATPSSTNLQWRFPMTEGVSTTTADVSSNKYIATFHGNAAWANAGPILPRQTV